MEICNDRIKMTVKDAVDVLPYLRKLSKAGPKQKRKKVLMECPCKVFKVIGEIARNILLGHIHVPKKYMTKLRPYKKVLRRLAVRSSMKKKKRLLIQRGGFLPGLLIPAISLIANIAAKKFIK